MPGADLRSSMRRTARSSAIRRRRAPKRWTATATTARIRHAFLRFAREKNLPIEQLFKRVRLEVNNSTNGQQTPWESSSLTSDFYFFGDTAVAANRAPSQGTRGADGDRTCPSRSVHARPMTTCCPKIPENYQEFIRLYPHDPLCDRIRWLLGSLVQAKAWHSAVLANSPLAYKTFYDKYVSTAGPRTRFRKFTLVSNRQNSGSSPLSGMLAVTSACHRRSFRDPRCSPRLGPMQGSGDGKWDGRASPPDA
jgi:hypothetical protein